MDPRQKWNPGLISGSSQMPTAETSQEGTAASQPSSSEQLMMGLGDLSLSPGSNPAVPVQEGLFQQQYREEKTLLEQHWERLGFPQKKKALLGHFRRRHRDHMAPYPVERETSISFPESCDVHSPSQGPEISSEPKTICIVSVSF
ncbi:protein FAM156A/FAM156B isoform X2 [Fukomys damarensis]|uniref:protein FAM156A/FAM156B isoform X2 n=1 Tax=Fukomys damarensis TaxID=885580 RepID=UPI00053F2E3C|nr:protein FAM156A/FAM156B isoform X2 [Fukomys damarensis]